MSAFDNFMSAFFPGVGQRRMQQMRENQYLDAMKALEPFTRGQTITQPYQLSDMETFGPTDQGSIDPLDQLRAVPDASQLASSIQTPGLFNQEQAQGLARMMTNPATAKFG